MTRNEFSVRLHAMRTARGMSQLELGTAAGISQRAVYDYERGSRFPTLRSLLGIRDAFGCTWEELLGGISL